MPPSRVTNAPMVASPGRTLSPLMSSGSTILCREWNVLDLQKGEADMDILHLLRRKRAIPFIERAEPPLALPIRNGSSPAAMIGNRPG